MLYWALRNRSGNMNRILLVQGILCSEDVYLLSLFSCCLLPQFFYFCHKPYFLECTQFSFPVWLFPALLLPGRSSPHLYCARRPVVLHPPWESPLARVRPALLTSLCLSPSIYHTALVSAFCFPLGL